MPIVNTRAQHPVGQGFFHSASLWDGDRLRLSYVYDCGAMARYAAQRKREIKKYLGLVGARSLLDLVFISHVHADHLNGLEQLLDGTHGVSVDTIVLPLVNVADRLIAFARTAAEDSVSAQSAFYRAFVVDPGEALGRFQPQRIIYVEPGDRGGGAPDGDGRPLSQPGGQPLDDADVGERGREWKLAGRGVVRRWETSARRDGNGNGNGSQKPVLELVMPDTIALVASSPQGDWLLAPFVDPTITVHRRRFLGELAKQCQMSKSKLDSWLKVTANVQKLVTTDLNRLTAAYGAVTGNLNITSLCLYSGPARGSSQSLDRLHTGKFGCVRTDGSGPASRIAWLATGDAALKQQKRRADFVRHYRKLLHEVVTLTLPHHGSYHNFDVDLLNKVKPRFCVAAADRYSTWKHPGPHTVQAVFSLPAVLQVVTSSAPSAVSEFAALG